MSPSSNVPGATAPSLAAGTRGLIRWVCTKNPFYVISAGLFLAGLWISFGKQTQAEESWALMGGLASYTLLLAVTACLLVRYANVWDDVRTVLLLVVLMFLATSVTFDEVLTFRPALGFTLYLGGLLFAVAVTEGVLRGVRLRLPAWFRVSYYLILALFFLYPLALRPLQDEPHSAALMWGLFGFSPAAGLVFLTLIPAIRQGPLYVRDNGSPWDWPLYPWTLFGILGLAVPARTLLLCWSMQLVDGVDRDKLIFGGYFLVPFGLAVGVLLLEIGLASPSRGAVLSAMMAPVFLVVLAAIGHHSDAIYRAFLDEFMTRLGGSPLFLTLLAAAGFYAYAMARRVPLAGEALTATLTALAIVGPRSLYLNDLVPARAEPLFLAATLQLVLALRQHASWRCLLGTGLAIAGALAIPVDPSVSPLRGPIAFHLVLAAVLLIGAAFDDLLARLLRDVAAVLVLQACLTVMLFGYPVPGVPPWAFEIYVPLMALLLVAYFWLLRHALALMTALLILVCWLADFGWRGYVVMRQLVVGLDYLVLSMVVFVVAVLVSVIKSGLLFPSLTEREEDSAPAADFPEIGPAEAE